jgi:GT2 family glycosyltransferase
LRPPADEPSGPPLATVVVPTFRRPSSLARALDGLARQRAPFAWEVVVVDNDHPPGAEPVVAAARSRLGVPLRLVREARRGAAHARNRGIAEAAGVVTALLDDDVVPRPGWLERIVEPVAAGRADGVGGRVLLDEEVPRPRWLDEGLAGYLAHFDPAHRERDLGPEEIIVTANAAFRTDLLRAIGGFDPALGPRPGVPLVNDDTLLTRRLRAAGARLRYVPEAVVVHELPPERLRLGYLVRRVWAQGRSDWLLDRDTLLGRRLGGPHVALRWLRHELRQRLRDGLARPDVAVHAFLDVVRWLGFAREALVARFGRGRPIGSDVGGGGRGGEAGGRGGAGEPPL